MKLLCCFPALLWAALTPLASAGSATWAISPANGDWNTATNWTPATVPNGLSDTATFAASDITGIALSSPIKIASCIFDQGASAYRISAAGAGTLTFAGAGVINDAMDPQIFIVEPSAEVSPGSFSFVNEATVTGSVRFIVKGAPIGEGLGVVAFHHDSSAGAATFLNEPGDFAGGATIFFDHSTAGSAHFVCQSDTRAGAGSVDFIDGSSAGNATFIVEGSGRADMNANAGIVAFETASTADHARFTIDGSTVAGGRGAAVNFFGHSTAADSTLVVNGSDLPGATGGSVNFVGNIFSGGSAGNATIIVKSGAAIGGACVFAYADGGSARIEVLGNGTLTTYYSVVPIGSLEGDGMVLLSGASLAIGSNNLSTTFAGVIADAQIGVGTLTKTGAGTLTLRGGNTYSNGTQLQAGTLLAANTSGSATGTGAVTVNGGTLGGKGMISGPVTIGTGSGSGAILAPSVGSKQPLTLSLTNTLTFQADSTYICQLSTQKRTADQVIAKGVTIAIGAQFALQTVGNKRLSSGAVFTLLSNTSATPISGTFANLADGSTLTAGRNKLKVSYTGGDGNDLTLTVVP